MKSCAVMHRFISMDWYTQVRPGRKTGWWKFLWKGNCKSSAKWQHQQTTAIIRGVEGYENSLGVWLGTRELKQAIRNGSWATLLIFLLPMLPMTLRQFGAFYSNQNVFLYLNKQVGLMDWLLFKSASPVNWGRSLWSNTLYLSLSITFLERKALNSNILETEFISAQSVNKLSALM